MSDDVQYLDVSEFTKNVTVDYNNYEVTGEGILDTLMTTATKHLTAQLEANRIRGEDYAQIYLDLYKATLQAGLQAWLEKPNRDAQLKLLEAQIAAEKMKGDLYKRQIQGFNEDFKQKILKILLDSWAVAFSVAKDDIKAAGIPTAISTTTIQSIMTKVMDDIDNGVNTILDNT